MKWSNYQLFFLEVAIIASLGLDYAIYAFIQQHGVNFSLFLNTAISNPVALFATIEVIALTLALGVWMFFQARTLEMKNAWAYMALCVFPSPAIAIPIFLAMRERKIAQIKYQPSHQSDYQSGRANPSIA
ncbi:MAG: DUF2834 domain-containing protein [Gammaproteobacteria bacterium]|nr:DUF2834 domain-containing protein [Gammaproteobacteria bacterium]